MRDERTERLRVQRRLIGLAAEKRLASVTVETRTHGFAEVIEARYLVGAGVGRLDVSTREALEAGLSLDPNADVRLREASPGERALGTDKEWASPVASAFHEGAISALRTLMGVMGSDVPTNG
ncbi:MAG: hypothetical protein KBF88_15975 [Polyangiaceae bacterium]|nr:hypothetical protein [Polyangiaceae bacterium]